MRRFSGLSSVHGRVMALASVVVCTVVLAAATTFTKTREEARAMRKIEDATTAVTQQIMPLSAKIATLRYDVAQVQQWLTDVSATQGKDGLDDGPREAAEYATDFRAQVAAANDLAKALNLVDVENALRSAAASFPSYYETGSRMAQAYIDGGPAAGNPLMAVFDAEAERMAESMTRLLSATDAAAASRVATLEKAADRIVESGRDLQRTLSVAGAAILAMIVLFVVFLRRSVTRPLARLTNTMRWLAEGRLDTQIGFETRNDEVGKMAEAVRVFQRHAIENQQLHSEQVRLRQAADEERRVALMRMANRIESETRTAVDRVAGHTDAMASHAATLLDSAEDTTEISQELAEAANQAFASAQAVAAATEQLSASIQEIGNQVGAATQVTDGAVRESQAARGTIEKLSHAVERIGAVAQIIEGFATETNLLALNATIEAARAGEAGRGFAVVANEVKNLANGTARSAGEIGGLLLEVRDVTSAAVQAVGGAAAAIAEVSSISTAIAAAVEQQGATTRELARTGEETSQAAQHVSSSAARAAGVAEAAQSGATQVKTTAEDMSAGVGALRDALVAIVRSATSDVDLRTEPRFGTNASCLVETSAGSRPGKLANLSEGGAEIFSSAAVPEGGRGTLRIDGYARRLPFVVRACADGRLHVEFTLSPADRETLARDLPALTTVAERLDKAA